MDCPTNPVSTEQTIYSTHAFLFPFEWRYRGDKAQTLEKQTTLLRVQDAMKDGPGNWERRPSWNPPGTVTQYNEVAYFYDFVRPILYDDGTDESMQLHYFLQTPPEEELTYEIELADVTYKLYVDDITVSHYDTGVGVVAFHLHNRIQAQSRPQDILRINAAGRRVYPPFLASNTDDLGHQRFFEDRNWQRALKRTKATGELPRAIRIKKGEDYLLTEDFSEWTKDQNLDRPPGLIRKVLPPGLFAVVEISPVLDDRMFVVSWYGHSELLTHVQGISPTGEDKSLADVNYLTNEWWYKFVFVDGGYKTCQNDFMTADLLKASTNPRWARDGTFLGVGRYSFVILTGAATSDNSFPKTICSHTLTMYHKMAQLGLVQRASLLRFSQEVTDISQLTKRGKHLTQRVSSLYRQYIRFVNRVYFREVTAQEQGIELYDMMEERMRLDRHVKALDEEVQQLHAYVNLLDEENRNEKLDLLTYFAALFVVPGFIASYYGIGDFKIANYWWIISLTCAASAGLALAIVRTSGRSRKASIIVTIFFSAFVFFILPAIIELFKAS